MFRVFVIIEVEEHELAIGDSSLDQSIKFLSLLLFLNGVAHGFREDLPDVDFMVGV